jgi:CelD/BcsL family acetyltransferase involved in cellulose biosynthesis
MLALFATYDPEYERGSPGILLMTEYTKWAFDQGIEEVDYLLGAERYKFRYANRLIKLHVVAAARTPLGWLTLQAERWRQRQVAEPDLTIGSAYLTEKGTPRAPPRSKAKRNESIDISEHTNEHADPPMEQRK